MYSVLTVSILFVHAMCVYSTRVVGNKTLIADIFESFGYTPLCVASALASCERFVNADFQFHLAEIIPELKNILKETKCDQKVPNYNLFVENNPNVAELIDLLREQKLERSQEKDLVQEICLLNSQTLLEEFKKANQGECRNVSHVVNKSTKNCWELYSLGDTSSGVRVVYPYVYFPSTPVIVFCDQVTDGGGWTVIHNRDTLPIRENFYRNWTDYKIGFGAAYGEFWLGLENIHALTTSAKMELRVDLEDYEEVKRWAKFKVFRIENESLLYKLSVGQYSGNAGDSLARRHNGKLFSTVDRDNDDSRDVNCAVERHGAWWYTDCDDSNLNGFPYVRSESSNYHGIQWDTFHSNFYSLKKASMKVRPIVD